MILSTTKNRSAQRERLAAAFPWILFVLTWIITFALQHRMDAPAIWLDGGGPSSDIAQSAFTGDMRRQVLIAMLGVLGAFLLVRGRERLRFNGAIAILLLAYTCWIGLSLTWADDPSLTLRRQIAFALMLVFSVGCVARMNVDILSVFIAGIAVLNLIPGIIAELRYGTLHPFASGNRFGGTVHPNLQGASLALAIIVLCWWLWRTCGPVRLRLACINAVLLVFMLMTGSRTAMIALAVAVGFSVVIVLARDHKHLLLRLIGPVAMTVGLVGLAGLAVTSISERPDLLNAIHANRDTGDVSELTGRVEIWQTCLRFVSERPILGFGFDGFWSEKRIEMISEELQWPINQAHSAYLDQLLSLGVPGVGLYILLLLGCFFTCIGRFLRGEDRYGAWAALLLFIVIHNATESINVLPTFPNFAFNLILLNLAFVKPVFLKAERRLRGEGVSLPGVFTDAGGNRLVTSNSESLCH